MVTSENRSGVVMVGDKGMHRTARQKNGGPMTRMPEWIGGVLTGMAVPGAVLAQERPYDWGWGMHPMWGLWGIWGIGMMLFMFLFWGLVIVGIIVGIRWLVRQGRPEISDSALEILRQRYARGDINREEFEAKRRDLRP